MKPRSKLQMIKAREAEDAQAVMQSLKSGSQRIDEAARAAARTPLEIGRALADKFPDRLVRSPDTFNRPLKTRDHDAIGLAYAQHMFESFPVPRHIRKVWIDRHPAGLKHPMYRQQAGRRRSITAGEVDAYELIFESYFAIAQGRSLFKDIFKGILTKKETHVLATCPYDLGYSEMLVYAVARTNGSNSVARSVAATKLSSFTIWSDFWRSVIRYFAANPLPVREVNDLVDYIQHRYGLDRNFSLKGRSILMLKRGHEEWVREMARTKALGNAVWAGIDVKDSQFKTRNDKHEWLVREILSTKELAAEGTSMRHCVLSYKPRCMAGNCGIFTMKVRDGRKGHDWERALTIEVDARNDRIVQIRGFANRMARDYEMEAVRIWANDNQLQINRYAA